MAQQLTIRVPASIRGIARRQRNEKVFWCHVEAVVEVAEADQLDNPEAMVLTYQRWSNYGRPRKKETVRMVSAGHQGDLYRAVKGPTGRPATIEDLTRQDRDWKQNPFISKFQSRAVAPYSEVLATLREIHRENTSWPVDLARKIAADLLLVDGKLWRKDIEPIWAVEITQKTAGTDYQKPYPRSIQPGIPFPIRDREAAEEAAKAWTARENGEITSSQMTLVEADPRYLSRVREGLLRELLTKALHSARKTLTAQHWMHGLPDDVSGMIDGAEALLQPGGLLSGAADLVDYLRRQIDREDRYGIPAPRGSWLAAVEAAISLDLERDLIAGGPSIAFDPHDELLLEALA